VFFFFFRKPKVQEVVLLTVEETRVIPIDLIKSEIPTNENDAADEGVNDNSKEEQTAIKSEDPLIDVNEEKDNVEEEKSAEENVEEEKVEETKSEEEKVEETEVEE